MDLIIRNIDEETNNYLEERVQELGRKNTSKSEEAKKLMRKAIKDKQMSLGEYLISIHNRIPADAEELKLPPRNKSRHFSFEE